MPARDPAYPLGVTDPLLILCATQHVLEGFAAGDSDGRPTLRQDHGLQPDFSQLKRTARQKE